MVPVLSALSHLAILTLLLVSGCGRLGFDVSVAEQDAGVDAATSDAATSDAPVAAATNRVFISSQTYLATDLGGPAGGDAACQALADAEGLAGTYRAWLSSATELAPDRLRPARGWVRMDGRPFADEIDDLIANGEVFYPLIHDETGAEVALGESVMTMTTDEGGYSPENCDDYTANTSYSGGVVGGGTCSWTDILSSSCASPRRILCFGVDHQTPVQPSVAGRLAFYTTWNPGGGIADADRRCEEVAGRSGFKALLSTSTASAASRFDTTGEPWVRPDGVQVSETADDLMQWRRLAPMTQEFDGDYRGCLVGIWTGFEIPTDIDPAYVCGTQWDITTGTGLSTGLDELEDWSVDKDCDSFGRIWCLEE